jgi:hypothetical protein
MTPTAFDSVQLNSGKTLKKISDRDCKNGDDVYFTYVHKYNHTSEARRYVKAKFIKYARGIYRGINKATIKREDCRNPSLVFIDQIFKEVSIDVTARA